jgi:uncharacterized repeat protein (TIGR01451 family)
MPRLLRASFVLCLLTSLSVFAQSADQEMLSATDSPDPVIPGNNITYSISIRNNGPDAAVNGGLNAAISGSLTVVSATSSTAGFTCFTLGTSISCINPSFPSGTTANFTVVAAVPASLLNFPDGSFSSFFSPSGTTADPNNGNNSATVTTNYNSPQIDLSVAVTDSPDPVFPDGDITYTVAVSNTGPDPATNVNFNLFNNGTLRFQSMIVPAGWTCPSPAVGSVPTFTCTRASFASASGTSTFTIVLRAELAVLGPNDGTVSQVFSVNGIGDDTNDPNNTEVENTVYSTADANLGVTASDSPDPITPDANITYTVNVTNAGPDTAAATLNVPMNGTFRFQSITIPAGFNCPSLPAAGGSASFSCTNPSFASGGNVDFTIVLSAEVAYFGNVDQTIVQNFNVTGNIADPVNTNNSVNVSTSYQVPDADLVVTNADSPDPVSSGATITYTQTLTNTGPDTAVDATISSTLPSSVGFVSIGAPVGFTCSTPPAGGNGPVSCTNTSFANGATANFTLVVEVLATSGTVTNTAVAGSPTHDPDGLDNSAQVFTTILTPLVADLGITKSTASDSAAAGATLAYTITLINNGPDSASNVVVTDTLPAELLFQSIVIPAGFSCSTPAVGATGTVTCTASTFPNGSTANFTLVVKLTGSAVGPINNTATATSDTDDNTSGNDSGAASPVTVGGSSGTADLAVTKTTATTNATPGESVTYTITVNNGGPNPAAEVVVTDTLPATLLFQSITPAAGFTCSTPAVGTTGTITCLGGPVAVGTPATFSLVTSVAPSATGSIANGVAVSGSDADSNAANSSVVAPGIVVALADLSITKTTTTTQAVTGSTINYTITVTNNGPDAAQNVVVNDNLPTGLQFVSATPSQGTCAGTDPFSCSLGTLAGNASATITLQALVTATSGTVSNTASVTADTDDGTPGNNTSSTPSIPVTSGEAIAAIPTLSKWMLIALAMMLAAAAALTIRQ